MPSRKHSLRSSKTFRFIRTPRAARDPEKAPSPPWGGEGRRKLLRSGASGHQLVGEADCADVDLRDTFRAADLEHRGD
jgi:hypothetical protein